MPSPFARNCSAKTDPFSHRVPLPGSSPKPIRARNKITNGDAVTLQSSAPHLAHPETYAGPFKDWGPVPTMIEGQSQTSGLVIHKGPDGESESGIWICTPGYWHCHVTSDEFCHFLSGRCTY